MATPYYLIGGLLAYLLAGLFVLAWQSRQTPELWPSADFDSVWHLLGWPFVLLGWRIARGPTPTANPTPTMPNVVVGTTGIVVSELRPFGRVEIAGTSHEAKADHGTISVGATVQVVRVERVVVVRERR